MKGTRKATPFAGLILATGLVAALAGEAVAGTVTLEQTYDTPGGALDLQFARFDDLGGTRQLTSVSAIFSGEAVGTWLIPSNPLGGFAEIENDPYPHQYFCPLNYGYIYHDVSPSRYAVLPNQTYSVELTDTFDFTLTTSPGTFDPSAYTSGPGTTDLAFSLHFRFNADTMAVQPNGSYGTPSGSLGGGLAQLTGTSARGTVSLIYTYVEAVPLPRAAFAGLFGLVVAGSLAWRSRIRETSGSGR